MKDTSLRIKAEKTCGRKNSTRNVCESLFRQKDSVTLACNVRAVNEWKQEEKRERKSRNHHRTYSSWAEVLQTNVLKGSWGSAKATFFWLCFYLQFNIISHPQTLCLPNIFDSIWIWKPNYLKWESYTIINFIPSSCLFMGSCHSFVAAHHRHHHQLYDILLLLCFSAFFCLFVSCALFPSITFLVGVRLCLLVYIFMYRNTKVRVAFSFLFSIQHKLTNNFGNS